MSGPALPESPFRPHVVLDGDMPRCSECDSATLVAVERVTRVFEVANRALLPVGMLAEPTLMLAANQQERPVVVEVRCTECLNVLSIDGYATRVREGL